jgi:hypothetical protein
MSGTDNGIFSKIVSFGDVAAEDDAVLSYFLATNAVETVSNDRALIVLGRKGTGKTALVRYFTESHARGLSKSLNLRGYPWTAHSQRVDRGASDIEAYVSSWRYLIAVELASLVLSDPRSRGSHCAMRLSQFLKDNYGGTDPSLADILRPARLHMTKFSIQPSVMGNQIGGVDLDRTVQDYRLGLELNAVSSALLDSVAEVVNDAALGPLSVHFDELDQGLSKFDESRQTMLVGLVIAARDIRRETEKRQTVVNPVVYLRTDLWDDLQFSDKNKISQTERLAFHLGWNSEGLLALINIRLRTLVGPSTTWEQIASADLMRGSQTKWNHILSRTFLRPRDVIRFCNAVLSEAKKR